MEIFGLIMGTVENENIIVSLGGTTACELQALNTLGESAFGPSDTAVRRRSSRAFESDKNEQTTLCFAYSASITRIGFRLKKVPRTVHFAYSACSLIPLCVLCRDTRESLLATEQLAVSYC